LDDWRWKELSFEQELYLKKLIIKHTLEKELEEFSAHPSLDIIDEKTILLKYIYHKCLLEFPPFKTNTTSIKSKLQDLLLQYPTFSSLLKKAKKDNTKSSILIDIFDVGIETSLEHKIKAKVEGQDALTLMGTFSARREILELLQILLKDVAETGNPSPLFDTFTKSKTMDDIPPIYRRLFGVVYVGPLVQERLNQPIKLAKMKSIYHLTPRRSLKALFTVTSPVTIISNILSLFLSKPLGAKSLLQRFVEEGIELEKAQEEINEKRKVLNSNKNVIDKVQSWVANCYDPIPNVDVYSKQKEGRIEEEKDRKGLVLQVLLDVKSKPEFEPNWIAQLQQDAINAIYRLIKAEMAVKDKLRFVEFLGEEKFISPIKDIIATCAPPLVDISNSANPPTVLSAYFKLCRELIAVAESSDDGEKKANGYHEVLCRFEGILLPTIQAVINADSGLLAELVMWTTDFFDTTKKRLNLIFLN